MEYNISESKAKRRELRNNSTKAEMAVWALIRIRQVNDVKFRRQFWIGNYIVDFFSSQAKLIIEIDGAAHENEESKIKDMERQKELEESGFSVLRFTNDEVLYSPDEVIEKIKERLELLIDKENNSILWFK